MHRLHPAGLGIVLNRDECQ
ncbi:unnamed protein product [Callosobruchus maculatus]|uniref:Uncharacterized protein n=1 Tax=Callosobruchus maculatus TaxID=64391 RepID=A0A653CTX0_CALMS|nr:unnamed protein product [Callosobruchus maculatus]